MQEAHRVLSPGGRVACTVWAAPDALEAFGLFFAAVEEHAGAAELRHGPLFGVAERDVRVPMFTGAGFADVAIQTLATTWRMATLEPYLQAFRTWAQLDTFPQDAQRAIEETVRSNATRYQNDNGFAIPNPMLLINSTKPA